MLETLRIFFGAHIFPYLYSLRGASQDTGVIVVSDLSIAAAHVAMVIVLVQVMLKRRDPLFSKVVLVFTLFLGFRGASQFLAIWTVWHTKYQLGTGVRTCSTVLSITTAVVLVRLLPVLYRLPSSAQMQQDLEERRQAEEAIRDREERFRSFVESVEDYAIYMIDPQGIVLTWNQGAERMKGYTAKEIVGRSFAQFYTPEDRAVHKPEETLRMVTETGRFEGEVWRIRKDGTRFLANVVLRPLYSGSGQLRGFSKVTRDLTETREMEEKYRILLEAAPDAIVIVDSGGAVQFINAQAERLFGYDRAEVVGAPVDMLVPQRTRETQAIYRDRLIDQSNHPLPDAPPVILGLRKDGSDFPLEFSVSPLDTKEGRVLLFAVRDLTERQETEARFRALLESAPDAMVISSSDGRIELTNLQTERLFGYSREELAGKSVEMLIPPDLRDGYSRDSDKFLHGAEPYEIGAGADLRALRKDGSEFPVEIRFSPLAGAKGILIIAAIRDITERKQAAQQLADKMTELRHSNEALEQFAHIASHDLQEPLRMVASYTQLLARRYKGRLDQDADEFIEYAVDGTRRMKQLIEDLLLYSRAGKGSPPVRQFSAEESLREALLNLQSAIQESGAILTHDPLPVVVAVDSQVTQIFQNLIGNAIKYRGDRIPHIHVSATETEREWIFSVADNGIGIDARHFDRIFEIFQRLHGRAEYTGTGIGLAICKRILHQQGGRIWVESELGQGSVFYFSLPVR